MNPGRLTLEARKRHLAARIAAQRSQLEWQVGAFRRPLQAFELARRLGGILRLASRAARWWVLARLGWRLLRR
jgi:hypothetical protein